MNQSLIQKHKQKYFTQTGKAAKSRRHKFPRNKRDYVKNSLDYIDKNTVSCNQLFVLMTVKMRSVELLSSSPARHIFFPVDTPPLFSPYGASTAINVLGSFLGTPEIATQVGNKNYL